MPCHRVYTVGRNDAASVRNRMVAPELTNRLTLDSRWIAPVRKVPAGTTTRPPPAALQAAIALRNAAVQSALPSPLAPYEVIAKSLAGNVGGTMRLRITGT